MLFTKTGAVACFGAAVMLLGFYSGPAAKQAEATPATHSSSPTWRTESSGTRQRLYDVACWTAQRCEAVGDNGTILATANGGKTWRKQTNPLSGSTKPLVQIACVSPGYCYVIARPDTILFTHNGGASWTRHTLNVGVSGGGLTDKTCLGEYPPGLAHSYTLCGLGLLDVTCISARVCYAISDTAQAYSDIPLPSKSHAQPSSIWLTTDAGAKWTRQSIPPGEGCNGDCSPGLFPYPLKWVTCLSSGLCRAGGGQFLGCGHCGFVFAVLVTHGPGRPWVCTNPGLTCSNAPDVATCRTSTRCYGVDSTNPFSIPDNAVLGSTDSGANWGQIGPDWSSSLLTDIACPTTLTCYLTGTHGSIAKITNGTTVAAQHTPTTRDLNGIACFAPATCYAVGDNGTILALR